MGSLMDRRWTVLSLLSIPIIAVVIGCSTSDRESRPSEWECPDILPPTNQSKVTITQGIWGDVWFWQGIFSYGVCTSTGTVTAVPRELRIHEFTRLDQLDYVPDRPAFFTAIHSPLVATVHSDESGFFQIELPPGQYSLFVVEDSLFFAGRFSVTVKPGEVTPARVDIDYKKVI
jgi:hypothetical protein